MAKENEKDLEKLNPKKKLISKMFRKHDVGKKPIVQPKKPALEKFPEQEKEKFDILHFLSKNLLTISIVVVLILIIIFGIALLMPRKLSANFIDKTTGDYIQGYVYFDNILLGETDGKGFDGFTQDYCSGGHILRIESGEDAFEWQTYPVDCKADKLVFEVDYKEARPSERIILRFIDDNDKLISGKLYLNSVFSQDIDGFISIPRDECKNITKITLKQESYSGEWENNPELCKENSEIKFKISGI